MDEPPKIVWRADYHCKLTSQYVHGFVLINEYTHRYGELEDLKLSLRDTEFMSITELKFTEYRKAT